MAMELMMGYSGDSLATKMQKNAVREAATSGIQSVEEVIKLLRQNQLEQQQINIMTVTDMAVNNFRKVISLLGRTTRTGHARFRRAPVTSPAQQQKQEEPESQQEKRQVQEPGPSVRAINSQPTEQGSAFRDYQPTPIHRLPPLPHNQQPKSPLLVTIKGLSDRNETPTTISFSNSPSISSATSFMSSLTGETDSFQRSMSSGFHFTQPSAGKPPLSTSSNKRKCDSMDGAALKCGSSSGRCHCSKKSRKSRVKRVVRVPATSNKMADIPTDDYSWRKYGQKPIKGILQVQQRERMSSTQTCGRAPDDSMMLIVTYEGEHHHSHPFGDAPVESS
ncbi:WRKY transcription factor [Salix suchowensis]|nr:WRKY transcription factor [Salix suchowensis]